jgi:hypothetical protein
VTRKIQDHAPFGEGVPEPLGQVGTDMKLDRESAETDLG